jgi:hypothetical protein
MWATMADKTNIYGRHLPIEAQKQTDSSNCVDCHHPHWDTIRHLYVRCAMCKCENVGQNVFGDHDD